MAKLTGNGTRVVVELGDTLSEIAKDYGKGKTWQQLASLNSLPNPHLLSVGQEVYLEDDGSFSPPKPSGPTKVTIRQFGLQSNTKDTLFVTWDWSRWKDTKEYKVVWLYSTGDGVQFVGNEHSKTIDSDYEAASRQDLYTIPDKAKSVWVKILPVSKTKKENDQETTYFSAKWVTSDHYNTKDASGSGSSSLDKPSAPQVEIKEHTLTATLDNINIEGATAIQFQVIRDNTEPAYASKRVDIVTQHASHQFTIAIGSEYKVRCRAYRSSDKKYGEWSDYSDNYSTMPDTPSGITAIRATSETSVYLEWAAAKTATSYELQYTTKKTYFDGSDEVTSRTGIEFPHFEVTGLESGKEYFFRVRAVNDDGESSWTEIESVVVGSKPSAPTTWSSTTTAITGEPVTLYWVHNAEDGSIQTYAELEMYIDGVKKTYTLRDAAIGDGVILYTPLSEQDKKDGKVNTCAIITSPYREGTKIEWRIRTAGITKTYGDWSAKRTIDIYAPATLELRVTDIEGNAFDTLRSFPFYIYGLPGPSTQAPIGYHVSVKSNEIYESVDNVGNPKTVNAGEEVYSKHFDINTELLIELSAGNIDLENGVSYTVTCTVSMNSGLTATQSLEFNVDWVSTYYEPNAEISIDPDTMTASIRPYCEDRKIVYYRVTESNGTYARGTDEFSYIYGEPVEGAVTTEGDRVYSGTTAEGENILFCSAEKVTEITGVLMSVYRREFDGGFTELARNLDISKRTSVTDPHPALDYARYRIVATDAATGAVSYYDLPGYPVGGTAVIIQWDEAWTNFEVSNEDELAQPIWAGSILTLPYNIDVSDSNTKDVYLVGYAGREDPVAYYGTQRGHKSTWNVEIVKTDRETLYALRRLQNWMGDVYVREPSGSGYWASISVSFSQKHKDLTIPVTLSVTRVEGGV